MKLIFYKAVIMAMIATTRKATATTNTVYNVWNDNGIHLIMSDNGTPNDYSDDIIIDYENNRNVTVKIYD